MLPQPINPIFFIMSFYKLILKNEIVKKKAVKLRPLKIKCISTYIKSAAFSLVTNTVPVSMLSGMLSPLANLSAFSTPMYPMLYEN